MPFNYSTNSLASQKSGLQHCCWLQQTSLTVTNKFSSFEDHLTYLKYSPTTAPKSTCCTTHIHCLSAGLQMHHSGNSDPKQLAGTHEKTTRTRKGGGESWGERVGRLGLVKTLTAAPLICAPPHPATQPPTAVQNGLISICKGPALDCDIQPYWEIKENDTKTKKSSIVPPRGSIRDLWMPRDGFGAGGIHVDI